MGLGSQEFREFMLYALLIACSISTCIDCKPIDSVSRSDSSKYNYTKILDKDLNGAISLPELLDDSNGHWLEAIFSYLSHLLTFASLDSDGEGLIDFDEKHVYRTDPYKPDNINVLNDIIQHQKGFDPENPYNDGKCSSWFKIAADVDSINELTNSEGFQVYIDGRPKGVTDAKGESRIEARSGPHIITASKKVGTKIYSGSWSGRIECYYPKDGTSYVPINITLMNVWTRTYSSEGDQGYSYTVQQTNDEGFIITCLTRPYNKDNNDILLIRTDKDGNKLWDKTFDSSKSDSGYSLQQTIDGGYIIAGCRGFNDAWLIKTDKDGIKLWDKTFDGFKGEFHSIQQTTDGGFVATGSLDHVYENDVLLVKIDKEGNELWNKTFGGSEGDDGQSVQQTTDGGFIVVGDTCSFGAGISDAWLIRTDKDGNKLWDKTFGGEDWEYGFAVQQTTDGGFIIIGCTASKGAGNLDAWLIKTDKDGNKLWDKTFGGSEWDEGKSVQQTTDGGFIIAGATDSYGAGETRIWMIKTDPNGNV